MKEFDYKKFLVENKLTLNSRLLNENISKFEDYISGMFNMSVDEEEGSQIGVWKKEEYASDAYEGTDFSDLSTYLDSVDGKATLEGNPDITVELLDSGDIKWSADVTLDDKVNLEPFQELLNKGNFDHSDLSDAIKSSGIKGSDFEKTLNGLGFDVEKESYTETNSGEIADFSVNHPNYTSKRAYVSFFGDEFNRVG